MITNPSAINVLCYGDSNTWGQKPDKSGRYLADIRWTGVLQKLLGDDYYIIEEGLGSRTTNLEYDRKPGRNGQIYLQPCIESHNPLDIVVVMLGTNDLKVQYNRDAHDIATALKDLLVTVQQYAKNAIADKPRIILVSPIHIDAKASDFTSFYSGYYDERAATESRLLAHEIRRAAIQVGVDFIDAATVAQAGTDGIHFDEASEASFGQLVARTITAK